jgi:hypothetical protein
MQVFLFQQGRTQFIHLLKIAFPVLAGIGQRVGHASLEFRQQRIIRNHKKIVQAVGNERGPPRDVIGINPIVVQPQRIAIPDVDGILQSDVGKKLIEVQHLPQLFPALDRIFFSRGVDERHEILPARSFAVVLFQFAVNVRLDAFIKIALRFTKVPFQEVPGDPFHQHIQA